MKRNESQKKENDREEKWYARMNVIEAIWRTRIAETRLEYLGNLIRVTKKRSESKLLL